MVGDSAQHFAGATDDADIIFNWSGSLALLRDVFLMSHRLRWIHSRSAGLEQALFPELVESEVITYKRQWCFQLFARRVCFGGASPTVA